MVRLHSMMGIMTWFRTGMSSSQEWGSRQTATDMSTTYLSDRLNRSILYLKTNAHFLLNRSILYLKTNAHFTYSLEYRLTKPKNLFKLMKTRSFLPHFNHIADAFFILWSCKDGKYSVLGKFSLKYSYITTFHLHVFHLFIINFNDNTIIRLWLVFTPLETKDVFGEVFLLDSSFDDIVALIQMEEVMELHV